MVALCLMPLLGGCAVVRYADYAMPALRFDRPSNEPLPPREDPAVQDALSRWDAMSPDERERYPSPYHVYVNTPEPGTFEGDLVAGLAFSGGGTRGTVFGAACVRELMDLGPVVVHGPEGEFTVDLMDEIDYVSGVSTGAIPAALFALAFGESCPDAMRFEHWPDCFNVDVQGIGARHMAARPDLFLRDMTFGMNTRYALAGAIAAAFFEGKPNHPASGLTFADLPETPVLAIGATIVNDPGVPLMLTRLPYRYAIDQQPDYLWQTGIQSFESLHSDPMTYPLGEASYGSSSFPGHLRAGQMRVREDRPWVYTGLDSSQEERMRMARNQRGYEGTYAIKDGGLVDNRGSYILHRLYTDSGLERNAEKKPLLLAADAGFLELRPTKPGAEKLAQGWMNELQSSMRASWQTGQDAYNAMIEATAEDGAYAYVRLRFTEWVPHMISEDAVDDSEAGAYLQFLCEREPLVGSPGALLKILRPIGTTFGTLSPEQLAAVKLCARFAVWTERERLLQWVSECHGGAAAEFAQIPGNS